MWNNNKHILWNHIRLAYRLDSAYPHEFRILHKITRDHVFLDARTKMKVSYAVQVLSERYAVAIEKLCGIECSETVTFIRMFNRLFDLLNVRSFAEASRKKNADLMPYTCKEDSRLQVMNLNIANE